MAKHTPGPWAVVGTNIEQIEEGVEIATVSEYRTMTLRQSANARLIAAAPDLLAALREADTYLHSVLSIQHDDVTDAVRQTVLAAIARATGQ